MSDEKELFTSMAFETTEKSIKEAAKNYMDMFPSEGTWDSPIEEGGTFVGDYADADVRLTQAIMAHEAKHRNDDLPEEFIQKRQSLAEFLLKMATGYSWDANSDIKEIQVNYAMDADDILREYPHLLGFETRDRMNLLGEPEFKEEISTEGDDEAPSDEPIKLKPSELPVNVVILDEDHGRWIKEANETYSEIDGTYASTYPDEHFGNFEVIAAPLGWEPPHTHYETMEFFNHETGKMERKAITVTRPERFKNAD